MLDAQNRLRSFVEEDRSRPMLHRFRLPIVVALATLFPIFVASLLKEPIDGPIGYPHTGHGSVPWTALYFFAAGGFTVLAHRRTPLVGLFCGLIPIVGLGGYHEGYPAMWLGLACLTGSWVALHVGFKPTAPRVRTHFALVATLAVLSPIVFFAARTSPREAAEAAATSGARAIQVFRLPDGRNAEVLVARSLKNLAFSQLGFVQVHRTAPGYWEADRLQSEDPVTGAVVDASEQSLTRECNPVTYSLLADTYGVCRLSVYPYGSPDTLALAGLAPRDSATLEVTFGDGRIVREPLVAGRVHGYTFWEGTQQEEFSVARVAFRDVEGTLLDARVGPGWLTDLNYAFADQAAGCRDVGLPCPRVSENTRVSISMLRPDEFTSYCHHAPPPGKWVFLGSVLLPSSHRELLSRDDRDRRLLGRSVVRMAAATDSEGNRRFIRLPASDSPCFPGPGNSPVFSSPGTVVVK